MAELFSIRESGDVAIVDCRGPMVFGGATADFAIAVRGLLAPGRRVILNLADVARVDSFGIGALFGAYTDAVTHAATLVICGVSPAVRPMLEQAALVRLVTFYDSEGEAIRALALKKPVSSQYH